MSAPFDHMDAIAFCRDLTPERAGQLQDMLASDPAAVALLREWFAARASLVRGMGEAAADPELFVLFALCESGRAAALTDSEKARVEEAAPALRRILAGSPGLAAVADRMRQDMQAFEAHWSAWFAETSAPEASDRKASASETSAPEAPVPPRASSFRPVRPARPARKERAPARPARSSRPAPARAPSSRRRIWRAGIGAAAIAAVATLVFFLSPASPDTAPARTAASETRTVDLPDGSSARLLGDARLTWLPGAPGEDGRRRAELRGSAFFDIAPGAGHFLLLTPDAQATALGTSFGVRAEGDGTEVVLVEGSLRLSSRQDPDRAVLLAPGQMSRMTPAGFPSEPAPARVHERLAWTGLFVFRAAPVRDILPVLSARYGVGISADETLLDERVTGRFAQDEPLAGTLEVVALAIGASVESGGPEAGGAGYRLVPSR